MRASPPRQPLLAQQALRRLGDGVGVGVWGMLPFLGDDPSENVFVDLEIAFHFWQCFRLDEKLHLPHHGLCVSTKEVSCRQGKCIQAAVG